MSSLAAPPVPNLRQDAAVIGLVGLAHGVSHFSQLLLPPLFPWLKDAFAVNYTQLGLLLTIFFIVSCAVQTLSGFVVDRFGPRPVLMGGLALIGLAAVGYALAPSYAALALCSVIAGIGNGVFHPVDYTLLNAKVHKSRLGHAYSVHGITGSLGWALAPALMVPVALAWGWRTALFCAAAVAFIVLAALWWQRDRLQHLPAAPAAGSAHAAEGSFDFLRLPAVWMCFGFFLFYAGALSVVQTYAPEAARQLHGVPVHLAAACLSVYMVCSAAGMVAGGFLATDPARCERIVGIGFGIAAAVALTLGLGNVPALAVPVLFGAMGAAAGIAGPSRDLLVKRSTPEGATGRVYGVVYSGLDIGQALTPLVFGRLMDGHAFQGVLIGLALLQLVLIASAFNVRRFGPAAPRPVSASA
ncbi:MFS transporter [Aquincola sp. S2]|uniref:MFS transporter n=1 Tax=Pseudaquabacterium terrae TaxID=2732868 RepID=A0ABX2EMQ7_9BURK|nr:MFS transporter [Aquabacterium terrae]NRF69893.1 MFS transporter [Aquabacterium terrae]